MLKLYLLLDTFTGVWCDSMCARRMTSDRLANQRVAKCHMMITSRKTCVITGYSLRIHWVQFTQSLGILLAFTTTDE